MTKQFFRGPYTTAGTTVITEANSIFLGVYLNGDGTNANQVQVRDKATGQWMTPVVHILAGAKVASFSFESDIPRPKGFEIVGSGTGLSYYVWFVERE